MAQAAAGCVAEPTAANVLPPWRSSPRGGASRAVELEEPAGIPRASSSLEQEAPRQEALSRSDSLEGSSHPGSEQAHACRSRWRSLKKYLVDPRRWFHRYFLLTLICFFIPGPYFHDSMVSAYKGPICDAMSLSNKEFSMLFALSSLTGVFCGPAGLVIVRLGRTRMALLAGFACALGSLFVVLGFEWKRFEVMLIGRFTFWLSLYILLMVQTLLVYSIFEGPSMKLAYSMLVFACRLGGSFSYFLSGPLGKALGIRGSLWLSVALVVGAFCATLLFAYLFRGTATAQAVRPLLGGGRAQAKAFSLGMARAVPRSAVCAMLGIACLYGCVFPFEVIADDMFQKDYGYNADMAGFLLTAIPLVSLASPLLQPWIGSAPGQQLCSAVAAFCLMAGAQTIFTLEQPWSPYGGCGLMGIGYVTAVCSLWIALPGLVRADTAPEVAKEVEGLATGLSYASLAAAQFVSNYVAGIITDESGYRWACVWFASLAGGGALCALAAWAFHRQAAKGAVSRSRSSSEPAGELSSCDNGSEGVGDAADPPEVSVPDRAALRSIHQDYYTS